MNESTPGKPARHRRQRQGGPPPGEGFIQRTNEASAYALAEQQFRMAWLARETAADLAETLALHGETAAAVAHATGPLVDRIELAMHFVPGAPSAVERRARALWRELRLLHGLLVLSLDAMLRREAQSFTTRGATLGARAVDLEDAYATAIGGALIGLRHYAPERGVHASTYVRTWVWKALAELAGQSGGVLSTPESGLKTARAVRRGATTVGESRTQQVQALLGGKAYVRAELFEDQQGRIPSPDAGLLEQERAQDHQVLHATLAELEDADPLAARAVRRAFELDEHAETAGRPERRRSAPPPTPALQRGLAWLREVYGAAAGAPPNPEPKAPEAVAPQVAPAATATPAAPAAEPEACPAGPRRARRERRNGLTPLRLRQEPDGPPDEETDDGFLAG